jgi:hypothetical protein
VEHFGDIEQTNNIAVVIAYGLSISTGYHPKMLAYQVSEMSADHELKSFSRTGGVSRDHRVLGHDLSNGRDPGVE